MATRGHGCPEGCHRIENARLTQLREEEHQEQAEQASMPLYAGLCTLSCVS